MKNGALCYEPCSSGFSDKGTATCTRNCPSGYSDAGLMCHYDGAASYTLVSSCSTKCGFTKGLLKCSTSCSTPSCRSGYSQTGLTCWYDEVPSGFSGSAFDPIKDGTYSRDG